MFFLHGRKFFLGTRIFFLGNVVFFLGGRAPHQPGAVYTNNAMI